jgi:hypothetical protein
MLRESAFSESLSNNLSLFKVFFNSSSLNTPSSPKAEVTASYSLLKVSSLLSIAPLRLEITVELNVPAAL